MVKYSNMYFSLVHNTQADSFFACLEMAVCGLTFSL